VASQFQPQETNVSINIAKVKDRTDDDGYFRFFFRFKINKNKSTLFSWLPF